MCTKQLLLNNSKAERKKYYANRYTNISEEEKNIKREYGRNSYNNMSEEDKQKLSSRNLSSRKIT